MFSNLWSKNPFSTSSRASSASYSSILIGIGILIFLILFCLLGTVFYCCCVKRYLTVIHLLCSCWKCCSGKKKEKKKDEKPQNDPKAAENTNQNNNNRNKTCLNGIIPWSYRDVSKKLKLQKTQGDLSIQEKLPKHLVDVEKQDQTEVDDDDTIHDFSTYQIETDNEYPTPNIDLKLDKRQQSRPVQIEIPTSTKKPLKSHAVSRSKTFIDFLMRAKRPFTRKPNEIAEIQDKKEKINKISENFVPTAGNKFKADVYPIKKSISICTY
jgi:hypothetical protein